MYGLPSFGYGGMVVSYFWRYHCRPAGRTGMRGGAGVGVGSARTGEGQSCYAGGTVSSALAFSYNSQNWTAFGQPRARTGGAEASGQSVPSARPPLSAPPGTVVGRQLLNNTDMGPGAYHHSYDHFANKTAGALACQRECDGDPACKGWTYVEGEPEQHQGVQERCCRHDQVGCPTRSAGMISAAKAASPCKSPAPTPPTPPTPEPPLPGPHTVPLPELFPVAPGTPAGAQVYPNTLVDLPEQGRVLVHASASTHQHGFVSTEPGTWSSLLTYQLRRDGFVFAAAASPADGASFITVPIGWGSGELAVNADCSGGGSVTVTVLDTGRGGELPGFGVADAMAVTGNITDATVTWKTGAKMAGLAGKTVSLQVRLQGDAKLYSLRGAFEFGTE